VIQRDETNLLLANSAETVDELNSQFYGRFPFPWRPMKLDFLVDPQFETVMLNQSLGDYQQQIIPRQPKIWVAGCGTNQTVLTALKFPAASVLGSDLSLQSLQICASTAQAIGLANLELRRESINQVSYKDRFDYIICTGVIMVNAEPEESLGKLAGALKPGGILELMVYNRYHRLTTSAFQKALRLLASENGKGEGRPDFETELSLAKQFLHRFPVQNSMAQLLNDYRHSPESALADALLQPVEYSYTVESLAEMAERCGMELLLPCVNAYDRANGSYSWQLEFAAGEIQQRYEALPDRQRWQVTNLLLLEKSPLLWFYLQRQDSPRRRKSEQEICEEFLEQRFERAETEQRSYAASEGTGYWEVGIGVKYPELPAGRATRAVVAALDGRKVMREILTELGVEMSFGRVNELRQQLTTSRFPYLQAVREPQPVTETATSSRQAEREQLQQVQAEKFKLLKRRAISQSTPHTT
jgi:SAM-dependent methyltransferase